MTSSNRDKSCAERIAEQAKGRIAAFADLNMLANVYGEDMTDEIRAAAERQDIDLDDAASTGDIAEDADRRIYELPLAAEIKRVLRIDLSTGGPADYLEVHLDSDNEPERIVYHFADWFDHAERTLDGDDFETVADFARRFIAE